MKPSIKTALLPILIGSGPALALAIDCDQGRALYEQAKTAATTPETIDLLRRSVAVCPDPVAFYQLGRACQEQGDTQSTLDAYYHARDTSDDPRQQVLIHGRLAQSYLAADRLPEALASVDTAYELAAVPGAGPVPDWLAETRRRIDLHPGRTQFAAADIARSFGTRRALAGAKGFVAAPKLDLYVLFDTDQDIPNAAGMAQVAALAAALESMTKGNGDRYLILGHTDRRGTAEHNQGLSERRAAAVRRLLETQVGALKGRIETAGRGAAEPRYPGDGDEDYRLNRRVEVRAVPIR